MIDFIDPIAWPAFNVADMCIVVGVLALLYVMEGPGPAVRLDAFLVDRGLVPTRAAAPAGHRAGARDRGRARRGPSPTRWPPGRTWSWRRSPSRAPEAPRPTCTFGVALRGRRPAGGGQARRAWWCTRAPGNEHGTLVQALAGRAAGGADPERPGIVHRLDRDTSGLLVVAKSEAAHAELSRMIREREVTRRYLALVDGPPAGRVGHHRRAAGARPRAGAR